MCEIYSKLTIKRDLIDVFFQYYLGVFINAYEQANAGWVFYLRIKHFSLLIPREVSELAKVFRYILGQGIQE